MQFSGQLLWSGSVLWGAMTASLSTQDLHHNPVPAKWLRISQQPQWEQKNPRLVLHYLINEYWFFFKWNGCHHWTSVHDIMIYSAAIACDHFKPLSYRISINKCLDTPEKCGCISPSLPLTRLFHGSVQLQSGRNLSSSFCQPSLLSVQQSNMYPQGVC